MAKPGGLESALKQDSPCLGNTVPLFYVGRGLQHRGPEATHRRATIITKTLITENWLMPRASQAHRSVICDRIWLKGKPRSLRVQGVKSWVVGLGSKEGLPTPSGCDL